MFVEVRLIKKDGKVSYFNVTDENQYNLMVKQIPEGSRVCAMFEISSQDGSMGQLAKLHASIRELALHLGYDFEDMKMYIKHLSGFVTERVIEGKKISRVKSFADCSKDELGFAIQMCIDFSNKINNPIA
jgi:hypothetical protein